MGTGFAGGLLRCVPCEGSRPFAVSHALHPIPQNRVRGHVGLVQCFPNLVIDDFCNSRGLFYDIFVNKVKIRVRLATLSGMSVDIYAQPQYSLHKELYDKHRMLS